MIIERAFLWATAAFFGVFGIWGLFSPAEMVSRFGIALPTADGLTFVRASYGGFLIGEASVIGFCALAASRTRLGLQLVILLTVPILSSRLIGMILDGSRSATHLSYVGFEAIGIIGAWFLLKRGRVI